MTQSGFDPASRFRFIQYIPHLEGAGWTVTHRPNRPDRQWQSPLRPRLVRAAHYRLGRAAMKVFRVGDLLAARRCEALFINRDLANEGWFLRWWLRPLLHQTVYDFDDALFVGSREPAVRWLCAHAGWVTPGNAYLAAYARQHTERVTVIPTVIDTDAYEPRDYAAAAPPARVRIGWSGSDQSIRATLVPRLGMLHELQAHIDFELVVITNTRPRLPDGLRWSFVPWQAEGERRLSTLLDIGIMPLQDDTFQRGKCGLKLLQYMAAGLPTVASPVGVNEEIVQPGLTGLLAQTDADWHASLERLLLDANLRAAMGQAGRRRCEAQYSVKRWLPELLTIFDRVRRSSPSACAARTALEPTVDPSPALAEVEQRRLQ